MNYLPAPVHIPEPPQRQGRSGVFGVLDIGDSKAACIIARLDGDGVPKVLGLGWQRGRGVKGGNIVDLVEAEKAIRAAVGQAEEMADTQLKGVIASLTCGQPESRTTSIEWPMGGRVTSEQDLISIVTEVRRRGMGDERETVHAFPLGFTVDATPGVINPRGMTCDAISSKVHLVDATKAALRNLGACLLRCDLEVDELISAPFAAGLSTLVEDERQIGSAIIDMGGGTTTLAAFHEGHLVHTAHIPVGGSHVTNDIARGLSTPVADAERLKSIHGGALAGGGDEREWLDVPRLGEDNNITRITQDILVGIIRPRVEETFEMVRDQLEAAGLLRDINRRIVLTGGASQLIGAREVAERILGGNVRLGRPRAVRGLAEVATGPEFAAPIGLLHWAAGQGRPLVDFTPGPRGARKTGLVRTIVGWLRDRT